MSQYPDDDLFQESTMTFGEHLEELRRALVKALLWLFAGTLVGFALGNWVVAFIKDPLVDAIKVHYSTAAAEELLLRLDGESKPEKDQVEQLSKRLVARDLLAAEYLVDPEVLRQAVSASPAPASEAGTGPEQDTRPEAETESPPDESASPEGGTDSAENEAASQEKAAGTANGEPEAKPYPLPDIDDLVPITLWAPMSKDRRIDPAAFNVSEAFTLWLKASILAGFVLASPLIFRELWLFVAAGLYPHEKQYVHVFLPFSIALFVGGALFCFLVVFPFILDFFFGWNAWLNIAVEPRISEWLSFALMLPLAFGLGFQLPLVMLFLERIGVFTIAVYLSRWRIAVLVIAVISMVLTPADPTSMIAMMVPLTVLYFGGILLCRYMPQRKGILDA
ncbi:MAG: twin-arginine translocase subunit TatC [Planctomycetota bacterium]|nr:MAG: twin-arginine translocase subunit TatC [Planctomycetota bacterium]REJ94362.1 MAG: twin-arginine translocase subunit TatC [Planctomycetota bacterium]